MGLKRQEMIQNVEKVLAPIPHEVDKYKSFLEVPKSHEKIRIEKNAERRHLENCMKKVCAKFHEATTMGKTSKTQNTLSVGIRRRSRKIS